MPTILITGASGMVGSYCDFGIKLGRGELDVTDLSAVSTAFKHYHPTAVIHLAACTDLALCERDPAVAYRINAIGTYHVALAARAHNARMVYVSTSGVFDGTKKTPYTPQDTPNPINVYGHSKYLGELAVRGVLENSLVARTSWIFGGGPTSDKKFVGKMLAQRDTAEVRAVSDRRGSPTYAKDLAAVLKTFAGDTARGVVHVGGGVATRLDVARETLALAKSRTRVLEASSADFAAAYHAGENESMELSFVRPWREALKEYIETEW